MFSQRKWIMSIAIVVVIALGIWLFIRRMTVLDCRFQPATLEDVVAEIDYEATLADYQVRIEILEGVVADIVAEAYEREANEAESIMDKDVGREIVGLPGGNL